MFQKTSYLFPLSTPLYSLPSPELKEQPSFTLIWSCYSSSPTSGSREILILCYPPLFISMFTTSYMGSFHVAHSPKKQRTSECKRLHSCLWAHSPGAAILHTTTLLTSFRPAGGSMEGPSGFHRKAHQLPSSVFFNLTLLRGRAEGLTAHLGPGRQQHGCHQLVSLSEKG